MSKSHPFRRVRDYPEHIEAGIYMYIRKILVQFIYWSKGPKLSINPVPPPPINFTHEE